MKSLIAALLMIAGPLMAQASSEVISSHPDDYEVEFLGWCENNNVMAQDSQGKPYVRVNCTETNLTCRTYQMFRMNRTLITAACVDNNQ